MRPYGASLLSWQKESKPCVPASGPTLRSGSLRSGIAPVGTAPKGRPGPTVLAGHPWPAPDYAMPTLSLLKGRSRVSGLTMYEEPDQHQKLNTSTSLLLSLLLCFSLHKSYRHHQSSLQQAECNPCVVGRRPWMAGERRRARTALRRGPRGSKGGMREPGAQRRAGCRDRGFCPLLPRQKRVAVRAKPASGATTSNGYAHSNSGPPRQSVADMCPELPSDLQPSTP